MRLRPVPAILAVLVLAAAGSRTAAAESPAGIAATAETLLAELDAPDRRAVLYDLHAPERRQWSNLPAGTSLSRLVGLGIERPGIRMGDLDAARQAAVFGFLRVALSAEGYARVRQIVRAEAMLAASFMAALSGIAEDNYWFAIFGTPSTDGRWAWQFGGHHLAVNATLDGDRMFLSPMFLGVEPARYEDGGMAYEPMKGELDGGVELMAALDPAQRAAALMNARPSDVYAGAGRDGVMPPVEGSAAGGWTREQQALLAGLVGRWIGLMPEAFAAVRLSEVAADMEQTRFAWHGRPDGSGDVYYRIQGPRLLIEFSAEGAGEDTGHYHSIYRNPVNEYGGVPPRRE